MANYGPDDFSIEIDTTTGGSLSSGFRQYVREINGLKIEAVLQESHSFGDVWFESLWTGIKKGNDVTIRGFYDDTASTGPNAIFAGGEGTQRSVVLTWGSTKTSSFEALILSYDRMPKLNELTMFEVVLRPTGTITEA
jgi:hypothetical protein